MENIDIKTADFVDLINNNALYGKRGDYISSLIMTSIIPKMINIGMSTAELKEYTGSISVHVTEDDIRDYLDRKFSVDNKEIKERIAKRKTMSSNILDDSLDYSKERAQRFTDDIVASRYSFNSYTLEYFKKYISILKRKVSELFRLIDNIQGIALGKITEELEIDEIIKELAKYDIKILPNGDIYYEDMVRLLTPLIENIIMLIDKANAANELFTYLNFSVSKEKLYRDGLFESELYPIEKLQSTSLYYNTKGCIRLSDRQKEELRSKELQNYSEWLSFVDRATQPRKLILENEEEG